MHLIHSQSSGLQAIQRYRYSTHLTVHRYTHTRVLSLHESYPGNGCPHSSYTSLTVTTAHMKSSLRSLIPFLPFLQKHLRVSSPELDTILILAAWVPRFIASRRTDRKHRFLYCCKGVFRASLHSDRSYPIVACLFVAAGMCLPSPCLAMGIHVTIC
jgi:hypothetical protein